MAKTNRSERAEEVEKGASFASPGGDQSRLLTVPNLLSALRLGLVPVFIWLFLTGREKTAVLLYGVGASTDWLDGYIARRTNQITELGKLLDPLADRIYIAALVVVLTLSDILPLWLAAGVLGRDALLLALFPLVDRRSATRIRVNFIGKSATACLLTGLTFLAVSETTLTWGSARDIGFTLMVAGLALYWISGIMYARAARSSLAARSD